MNRCRKCGRKIGEKYLNAPALRCSRCRKQLDEKLAEKEPDFDLFFKFYKWQKNKNNI